MTYEGLIDAALVSHGAVLITAAGIWLKSGDRVESTSKTLESADKLYRGICRVIADSLAEDIRPLLRSGIRPELIVSEEVKKYREEQTDPFNNTLYTNAVRDFIEGDLSLLVDARSFFLARDLWLRWTRRRSWLLLILVAYQLIPLCGLMVAARGMGIVLPDHFIYLSASPSFILVALVVASFMLATRHHDVLIAMQDKHGRVQA